MKKVCAVGDIGRRPVCCAEPFEPDEPLDPMEGGPANECVQ